MVSYIVPSVYVVRTTSFKFVCLKAPENLGPLTIGTHDLIVCHPDGSGMDRVRDGSVPDS